jgi:hypothetical protein
VRSRGERVEDLARADETRGDLLAPRVLQEFGALIRDRARAATAVEEAHVDLPGIGRHVLVGPGL